MSDARPPEGLALGTRWRSRNASSSDDRPGLDPVLADQSPAHVGVSSDELLDVSGIGIEHDERSGRRSARCPGREHHPAGHPLIDQGEMAGPIRAALLDDVRNVFVREHRGQGLITP